MESTYSRAVRGLLTEWAIWHHYQSGEVKGYPTRTPFDRMRGGGARSALIADIDAEKVDRAVARLDQRCPDQAGVLKLYYLEGMSIDTIRVKLRISRPDATQTLRQAETAVEWILDPLN